MALVGFPIHCIKRQKAADDEGLIAEALQLMSTDLWAELITESLNARHSTDARASAARPSSVEEFQERWGSVSEVSDGKCTPRPRRLEEMEPD